MGEQRSRLAFVFRPLGAERELGLTVRVALAVQGANGLSVLDGQSHPELHGMLEELSSRAGIDTPRAYVWHSRKPLANAVAISGKQPRVAFSETILEILTSEELTAVAAHELGHVKNMGHAGKLGMLAGVGGAAAGWVATRPLKNRAQQQLAKDVMAGKTTSPVAQALTFVKDMTIFTGAMAGSALASRSEEYAADRHGAMMMQGDGTPLMSGLEKLNRYHEQQGQREGMLRKLLKPYHRLTSSHPEFEKRREALGVTREEIAAYQSAQQAPEVESSLRAGEVQGEAALTGMAAMQRDVDVQRDVDMQEMAPESGSSWQKRVEQQAVNKASSGQER